MAKITEIKTNYFLICKWHGCPYKKCKKIYKLLERSLLVCLEKPECFGCGGGLVATVSDLCHHEL